MWATFWTVLSFPFRLIGRLADWLGRMAGAISGFVLMVAGMACCAGSLLPLGIPLFLFGLLLMLRSLG